ncbi:probable glutamate receptor isoform X2 [Folsomia candida]|nr:probable glutamate receptor isoform X2 [Folsomia candida]
MVLGMTFTAIIVNNVLLDQDHNPDIPDSLQFESSSQKKIELNCSQTMTSWIKAWAVSSRKGRNKLSSAGIGRDHWNVSDCFMWSMTAMSLRGFYKLPIESSLRIVMIVGSLAGIVLFAAYSGTLVSFLSVVIDPINNIGQLLATDFTFVVVDYELPLKFLSESPDAKGVMLFKRRRTDKSYPSMKEAREEMNRGRFVFVTDHAGAYESLTTDFSTLEACRIREIEVENGRQKQGTLVQRNSPYKRIIDYQILKTVQFGLVSRWSKKFLKKKSVCEDASEYEGVEIGSSSLAFSILLGFGWIAGWAGLLFEVWSRRRINQSNNCANEGFVL